MTMYNWKLRLIFAGKSMQRLPPPQFLVTGFEKDAILSPGKEYS